MRMLRLGLALLLLTALPARAAIDIQVVTSDGGLTAWLVEERAIPFTALELRFKGGASLDAEGKRGAIHLMTALLEEGAGDMDAQEFAAAADRLAAEFSFDVRDDALSVSARFLTENRDAALDLLKLALTEPRFDPDAIERVRAQVLSGIASDAKDPNAIASRTFDRLAFGDHPYGSPLEGTEASVSVLTRDDIVAAHARVIARDRVHAAAAGDTGAEALGAMLDDLLGDLPATGAPMPKDAPWLLEGGVTVVDFETPQSVITFGQRGLDRHDPDFFPAFVMTRILGGGGFSSRLTEEVREKRGLTYGIGAYLWPLDHAELLLGGTSTVNARAAETVDVIRTQWRRLSEEGVTEAELERAKTYLTGAYPLRFDGNARIANILVGMQLDELSPDYVLTRNDKVRAVTVEDIARVAADLVDPEALHLVVVGRPEGLSAGN